MTNSRSSNILKNPVTRIKDLVIGIKSAGEMATGIACRLHNANIKNIFMLETQSPLAVRRQVSFCETIYENAITVEGVNAQLTQDMYKVPFVWQENKIPIIVDPDWRSIQAIHPHVVIDAILARLRSWIEPRPAWCRNRTAKGVCIRIQHPDDVSTFVTDNALGDLVIEDRDRLFV